MKLTYWISALLLAMALGHWAAVEAGVQADQEDAAALSSREFVAQVICGPGKTAVWRNNYEHDCLKELP